MTRHLGNFTVTTANALDFPAITEFYGHLTIARGATLIALNLTSIRGWLTIEKDASLTAPMLGKIDGWLMVRGGLLRTEHLTEVTRDVVLYAAEMHTPALETVGSLTLPRDAAISLKLKRIAGGLTLAQDAVADLVKLERVEGSITMKERTRAYLPLLGHIGGYADVDESAVLAAPRFLS
jgi:hypothetical protein